MDENNIEIVVTPGNWQTAGRPPRWNWQVRQKNPPKFLVKGVSSGPEKNALIAARAAKAKILARVIM
jgi:hypothetical protein